MLGCSPQELGWREVETILLDHLSEAEAYAFTIANNRVAATGPWKQHAADGAAKADFAGHTRYRDRDERVRADRNRPVDRQGRWRRVQTEPPPNPEAGATAETGSPRCSRSVR
jgi:hypothetical protein